MDKKLKARWVKALKSGKYKQCQYTLYEDGSYCCLGVLAKVGTRLTRAEIEMHDDLQALGWRPIPKAAQATLISMNDDRGKTFKEIAQWIRTHL